MFLRGQKVWVEPTGWWAVVDFQEGPYVRVRYDRHRAVKKGVDPHHTFHERDLKTLAEHAADLRRQRQLRAGYR